MKQIHACMQEAGFSLAYSTLAKRVKEKRDQSKECFIKQEYNLAQRLEFDFGEVKLLIGGKLCTLHMAAFSAPASHFRYAYLYENQKQESFLDAHVRFFEMLGGVYEELVYDNMRNVVAKFVAERRKN